MDFLDGRLVPVDVGQSYFAKRARLVQVGTIIGYWLAEWLCTTKWCYSILVPYSLLCLSLHFVSSHFELDSVAKIIQRILGQRRKDFGSARKFKSILAGSKDSQFLLADDALSSQCFCHSFLC